MRLRSLDIQGYKTFASKTNFAFSSGITAIVGPNGSGKSNIADAIRWVLGEQSFNTLRGKRTEDMIFAGTDTRARLGMAEVSINLDNLEQWLPIEYSEVTISRRAYRSGENEYFLNGTRTRLRDITDLLSSSGLGPGSYVVIGQGLVDEALSLNPMERRRLFEQAAGITPYQRKRDVAVRKLEETRQNMLRVNDVISEIAPRFSALQRQAQRAEEYMRLSKTLEDLLHRWYGQRWMRLREALSLTEEQAEAREREAAERRRALQDNGAGMRRTRDELERKNGQVGSWRHDLIKRRGAVEALQRELAVASERQRSLGEQLEANEGERRTLEAQLASHRDRVSRAEGLLGDTEAHRASLEQELLGLREEATRLEVARQGAEQELEAARSEAFEVASDLASLNNHVTQLEERTKETEEEIQEQRRRIESLRALAHQHEGRMAEQRNELERIRAEFEAAAKTLEERRESSGITTEMVETKAKELRKMEEEYHAQKARLDLAERMAQEMTGCRDGIRALRERARETGGNLELFIDLLQVPSDLERAIEAALAWLLQSVVMDDWNDVLSAIRLLKRAGQGKMGLLPRNDLRPGKLVKVPQHSDVVGRASDLVSFDPSFAPVVQVLLGNVIIVRNLQAAWEIREDLRGTAISVSLDGDVVRSDGLVIAGSDTPSDGVLAWERQRRQLPAQISALDSAVEGVRAAVEAKRAEVERLEESRRQIQSQMEDLSVQIRRQEDSIASMERDAAKWTQEAEWRESVAADLQAEIETMDEKRRMLLLRIREQQAEQKRSEEMVAVLQAKLKELMADDVSQRVAELQATLAGLDRSIDDQNMALKDLVAVQQQLERQVEDKGRRTAKIQEEMLSLKTRSQEIEDQLSAAIDELRALEDKIDPAERGIRDLQKALDAMRDQEEGLRQETQEVEAASGRALLAVERARDDLENLEQRFREDLGETAAESDASEQSQVSLRQLAQEMSEVDISPGLEEDIRQLRKRCKALGHVNLDAPSEYQDVLSRYTFLTGQLEDLGRAAESLRNVVGELDQIMQERFLSTFEAVAREFSHYFSYLFDGGKAQLRLTDPESPSDTGVEILAQPPGRRQKSLSLLSGGERSLTAVALLLAILKSSPTPFCLLDEVDAMLDETNVGRFVEAIQGLSDITQFIVITHNRGTINAADALFGISMGENGVSQVMSLKLDDDVGTEEDVA